MTNIDNSELTPELKQEIDNLTQEDMARLYRFAPWGHRFFTRGPVFDYFDQRFRALGGMTPQLSKQIGWDR